jgi:hypothetical protein
MARHWAEECPRREKNADQKEFYKDIGRGGVVLAVAAMDAYFTRRFSELVVPYIKKRGAQEGLVTLLQKAGLDTSKALGLLAMERPMRHIRSLVDSHLEKYTTQKFAAIDELYRCLGLSDLTSHAERRTNRKRLKISIAALVERRHAIVHGGDLNKHGHLEDFDWRKMERRMQDLLLFVDSADELITRLERSLR